MTETKPAWDSFFERLQGKWHELPVGRKHFSSREMLALSDAELWRVYSESLEVLVSDFGRKGWSHVLYSDVLRNKRVLEVGSGIGHDALTFAQAGARVTCVDIVESNLELVRRLAHHAGVTGLDYFCMTSLESLQQLPSGYDFIWCRGSLITLPFDLAREQSRELLKHMTPRGRWVELAYPRIRWEREGKMPFETWGSRTDGGAPWMEWYDLEKIKSRLAPDRFRVVLDFEYHNSDFIWFDLERIAAD